MQVLPRTLPLRILLWLCALVLVGGYLRFQGVSEYYYNPDELSNIAIAKGDTVADVLAYSRFETHPPYPAILRHFLMKLSDDPCFLRGESAFFGLLCILVYYGIGTNAGGPLTGCIAAFILTFSYGNILQSQVVRNYTMLAFFLGCAYWCYQRFMRISLPRYALAYSLCGLLALMTHYSAIFLCFSIYAVSALFMLRDKQWNALQLWTIANIVIAAYFGFQYFTEIRHNAYEAAFEAVLHIKTYSNPPFNSTEHRLLLFLCYVPLTAAYYLTYPASAQILFFFCAILLYLAHSHRRFFCETIFALVLGAALVGLALYPYGLMVGGRHAIWILPYIVLPVSFFLSLALRYAHFIFHARFKQDMLIISAVMAIALIAGFMVCTSEDIAVTAAEHPLTQAEAQDRKKFLASLTSHDLIIASELMVPYLLPDGTDYYKSLVNSRPNQWYYSTSYGNTRLVYLEHPILQTHVWNMYELAHLLNDAGELNHVSTLWFVIYDGPLLAAAQCMKKSGLAQFFPPVEPKSPENNYVIKPKFAGINKNVLLHQNICSDDVL